MKKIAFFCIPAYGHTNPTLAVVRELISRNYLVRYYSFEQFREKIEACKAEYVSLDACSSAIEGKPEDMQKVGRDMAFSIHLLAESTLAVNETVLSSLRKYQPDLIIADSMAVWGRMAALKLNIPYITSMTTFAFNKDSAKIMKGSGPSMIGLLKAIPSMNRDVKVLRQAGYPVKNFLDLISASPDARTIVYTSKQFQPSSESFGDQYAFVGPSIALPPVESQTKCIYVSLGTVNNQNLEFFRNCLMALKEIAKPAIVSIGRNIRIEDLGEIPANVQTLPFTNQLEILQHCSVFLSHCGMN
ncbi:MAG: glucosyltransferase, partial [Erysipelotrichia bacterium]|nr:glucosyltransferase [Erysipelotrichia bacterium]